MYNGLIFYIWLSQQHKTFKTRCKNYSGRIIGVAALEELDRERKSQEEQRQLRTVFVSGYQQSPGVYLHTNLKLHLLRFQGTVSFSKLDFMKPVTAKELPQNDCQGLRLLNKTPTFWELHLGKILIHKIRETTLCMFIF